MMMTDDGDKISMMMDDDTLLNGIRTDSAPLRKCRKRTNGSEDFTFVILGQT